MTNRVILVESKTEDIEKVKPFMPPEEYGDIYHAATCLRAGATLITNDRDYDRLKKTRLVRIWSISQALSYLGIVGKPDSIQPRCLSPPLGVL